MMFAAIVKSAARSLRVRRALACCVAVMMTCFAGHQSAAQDSQRFPQHGVTETPMQRAGNPQCVAPWARSFPNSNYQGYYTGGGAALFGDRPTAFRGERRYPGEGTYGVDYAPGYSRVRLRWFHGRKQQGGEGQYEPDGHNNPLDDHLGFGPFKHAPRPFQH